MHVNHMAAYTHRRPIGEPHDRFYDARAAQKARGWWVGRIVSSETGSGRATPLTVGVRDTIHCPQSQAVALSRLKRASFPESGVTSAARSLGTWRLPGTDHRG